MRVRAFAKINLSLRVLGTRDDGYHELRTIFQSIALHDTLTIRARRGPFRADVQRSGVSDRRDEPGRARGGADVDALPDIVARPAAWRSISEADSDAGRPRRRQQRCRGGAARPRRGGGASRDEKVAQRRGASAPTCRIFSRAARCSDWNAATSCFRSSMRRRHGSCWCFRPFGVSTKEAFGWFDGRREREAATASASRHSACSARRP